jgi:hypothetical protein
LPTKVVGERLIFGKDEIPKRAISEVHRMAQDAPDRDSRSALLSWHSYLVGSGGESRFAVEMLTFGLECVRRERDLTGFSYHPCGEDDSKAAVARIFEFAAAYHHAMRYWFEKLHPLLSESDGLRNKRLLNRQSPELDFWLILIWPIVLRYAWTISDVERVRRLRFARPPADAIFRSSEIQEFTDALLGRVIALDAKRLKMRCKRLGLYGRGVKNCPKGNNCNPLMMQLALEIRT